MEDPIVQRLFALQDLGYRDFQAKLMPTVDPKTVIGVRTPDLRKLARSLRGTPEAAEFLAALPHRYYEENNLHGFLICDQKGFAETIAALDAFLPFVDNWATCDLMAPRAFQARPADLPDHIRRWLRDGRCYTVRFGVGMLLKYYLDEAFLPEHLQWVSEVCCEEYYVNMMVAWYFATALAKQPDATLPWIAEGRLPCWVHNKTIQKAVESYRIPPEQKEMLRGLRRREK